LPNHRRLALAVDTVHATGALRAVASPYAGPILAERTRLAGRSARRIDALAARSLALERELTGRATAGVAAVDAHAAATDLPGSARHAVAKIDARVVEARLRARANDTIAGGYARAVVAADLVGRARLADTGFGHTQPGRVVALANGARELGRLAASHAAPIQTDLLVRADRAVVDLTVAVVVDRVALLFDGLEQRQALKRAGVVALRHAELAGAVQAGVAIDTAARALHAFDAGDDIGEVVAAAAEDVFPREVELVRGDAAVVDEQVDLVLRIGIERALGVVDVTLAVLDARDGCAAVSVRARAALRRLGGREEEADLAALPRRIVLDIERNAGARVVIALEHRVQVADVGLAPRDVVPTEDVFEHRRPSAHHGELERALGLECLRRDLRVVLRVQAADIRRDARVVVVVVPHRALARGVLSVVAAVGVGARDPDVADAWSVADACENGGKACGLTSIATGGCGDGRTVGLSYGQGGDREQRQRQA